MSKKKLPIKNTKIKTFVFKFSSFNGIKEKSIYIDDEINEWIKDYDIQEIVDIKINSIAEGRYKNDEEYENFSNVYIYTIIYK